MEKAVSCSKANGAACLTIIHRAYPSQHNFFCSKLASVSLVSRQRLSHLCGMQDSFESEMMCALSREGPGAPKFRAGMIELVTLKNRRKGCQRQQSCRQPQLLPNVAFKPSTNRSIASSPSRRDAGQLGKQGALRSITKWTRGTILDLGEYHRMY